MEILFAVLTLLFLIAIIFGMINPTNVIFWGKKKTRGKVWVYYGLGLLFSLIMLSIALTTSSEDRNSDNIILPPGPFLRPFFEIFENMTNPTRG